VAHAVYADLDALVHEAFFMHAGPGASLVEKIYRGLFDDAGTDAVEHVFAGLPFQDDVIDAVLVQELAEQQSRWAGADDGDAAVGSGTDGADGNIHGDAIARLAGLADRKILAGVRYEFTNDM